MAARRRLLPTTQCLLVNGSGDLAAIDATDRCLVSVDHGDDDATTVA
jgi:hypothetical protein